MADRGQAGSASPLTTQGPVQKVPLWPLRVRRVLLLGEALLEALLCPSTHLIDEVADVPRMGQCGPDRVLGLGAHGPLIHPPHAGRLAQHVLHGFRLLQLAEVIVLGGVRDGAREGPQQGTEEPTVLPRPPVCLPSCLHPLSLS